MALGSAVFGKVAGVLPMRTVLRVRRQFVYQTAVRNGRASPGGGVPAKDFHGDRSTEPIAQQTINDLKRSTSLIVRITARRQRAVAALEIGRGKIVE
jgi:hypothetical protein